MAEIFNFSAMKKKSIRNSHKRQNYRKGRYSLAHFLENCKKVKIEVTGPKKAHFCMFSDKFTKNTFFRSCDLIFPKMCQITFFSPSGYFV